MQCNIVIYSVQPHSVFGQCTAHTSEPVRFAKGLRGGTPVFLAQSTTNISGESTATTKEDVGAASSSDAYCQRILSSAGVKDMEQATKLYVT